MSDVADPDNEIHINSTQELVAFCDRSRSSRYIGFDTEFVSENRYRPELCLLQVASDTEIAIVDTLAVDDLSSFWELLTTGDHVTIAHAAREEFLFCFRDCGRRPKKLFDIQLAAGFVGYDYPASYSNIVAQILGQFVAKGETRTDWKQRPLTSRQIKYAVGDVVFLHQLCEKLTENLEQLQRLSWYYEEVNRWLDGLEKSESEPQWHRVSGAARLNRRSLGILQELWLMRDAAARKKNRSAKRVIPDDLLIELAKRGSSTPSNFKAIRGFENRVSRGLTEEISAAIERGVALPDAQLPSKLDRTKTINLGLLGQFLSTVLTVVCRNQRIAPNLVGTAQDLRKLAAWRLGHIAKKDIPNLTVGWRAEIIGRVIDQAIDGKVALRVDNPQSDHPLAIEELS